MNINMDARQKPVNRPNGIGKELNQPNYRLMAKAFLNLYKEVGTVTKQSVPSFPNVVEH